MQEGQAAAAKGPSIAITLPDGAVRSYGAGVTGMEIAESISKSLAKAVIAVRIDGEICDLSLPILQDAKISLIKREDEAALELIRHDAAHVMAEAVQKTLSRHAGDDRPVHRERVFLTTSPATSRFRVKTSPSSKRKCARSWSAARRSPAKSGAGTRRSNISPNKGEMFKAEIDPRSARKRGDQDLPAGGMAGSVPRAAYADDQACWYGI
jgi:hypothetical protein